MSKHFFILIAFFTLILAACNPTNSNQNNQAEITVDIVASEDPIPVVANGQKIALWAKSSPPDAKFFWSLEGKGEIENDTSEAIFYIAPSKLEKDEQVVVLVEITDKDGNTAEDRQIIQLIPATPTPTPKPTDTPTPTITPSPTETPTPHPTPTATPEPCTMPSVHLPLNLSSSISAEFTDPVDCAIIIEPGFLVSGTYTGDLANKKIWGFVIPERDLRYYVQSPNACEGLSANTSKNESGGSWNTLASLGGPPQKYGIAVFVAEAEGETSTILSDHLDNSCKINSLRGFTREEMEEFDLIEIGSITVEKIEESND